MRRIKNLALDESRAGKRKDEIKMKDTELKNQLELVAKESLKACKLSLKKLKLTKSEQRELIKKDFDYCRKISDLVTSIEYVQWAYDWISYENLSPAALSSVTNCLKELVGILTETLSEKGSHE